MRQNTNLIINILKNSGPDFKFRDELIQLHTHALQLESSIKLRRQIEYEYNKLKLEEVKERIDEIEFQKKFYIKRNNDIINNIQKRNLKNIEQDSKNQVLLQNLEKQKKKYSEYVTSLIPKIQAEFNVQLLKDVKKIEKINELKMMEEMKYKNKYYDEMVKANEKLMNEINNLKNRNKDSMKKNKEKKDKFLESQNKLENQIDNFKIEQKNNEFNINEYYQDNQNNKNIKDINAKNKFSELNKLKLRRDSQNSETNSLQDLTKQIINPNKIDFINTLNQNFEKPGQTFDINNDNINDLNNKLENNKTPGEQINEIINLNDNEKKEDDKNVESKFNLLNSEKVNENIINNVQNLNNKNSINNVKSINNQNSVNNISNDVNFNVNIKSNNKISNNINNITSMEQNKKENIEEGEENYDFFDVEEK